MPAASNAHLANLKTSLFFAIGEGSRIFVACFLHSSAQMCLYQTPGRRPPPITGRFVNTVTEGWVGAPNGRAPFRFHGAVVGFVARCLSRTRNLAASNNLAEFFSGRSWPKIGRGMMFFGVFEKFETCFSKNCAHSERYRNLWVCIFEILTFYGNIAFPLSPVLPNNLFSEKNGYSRVQTLSLPVLVTLLVALNIRRVFRAHYLYGVQHI